MKKIICNILIVFLVLIVFVGCKQAGADDSTEDSTIYIVETIPVTTEEESSEEESTVLIKKEESSVVESSLTNEIIESEESVKEIINEETVSETSVEAEPIYYEESVQEEESEEIYYEEPEEVYEESEETFEEESSEEPESTYSWSGSVLTATMGVNWGPTGKETYYNLDMSGIISAVQRGGWLYNDCINQDIIDEILDTSGYWVRDDGCKMFGPYIIVAANLDHFHRGSIVECSLGTAIVLDTGGFASMADGWNWLDIATNW